MIQDAGPVWLFITHCLSSRCLQTRIQPSCCCRQKRDLSVNTMPFHSVVHVQRSSHHCRRKHLGQSTVNEAMDALRMFLSTANGVEWCDRIPNDA
ncbi:hypothetical protein TNCV_1102301 [Trichonephila clavipes]|nr:hypothetical protein TNCV_1102301 [Trichonephila clavipes]